MAAPENTADQEDARLMALFIDCRAKVAAASRAVFHPTRSMLMPEAQRLEIDFKDARAEYEIARTRLRDHRKSNPPSAATH